MLDIFIVIDAVSRAKKNNTIKLSAPKTGSKILIDGFLGEKTSTA